MREMAVDARVLALGMGRGWGPVSAAPLALQQNILTAFHPDQDAGDAVQAVQEVLNPVGGFADDVVHDDQGAFPGRLCNGGVERFNEGQTRPLRGRGVFRFSARPFFPMALWLSGRFAEVF